jgi:hypothetical protein
MPYHAGHLADGKEMNTERSGSPSYHMGTVDLEAEKERRNGDKCRTD